MEEIPPPPQLLKGSEMINSYRTVNMSRVRMTGSASGAHAHQSHLVESMDPVPPQLPGCIDINSMFASVKHELLGAFKRGLSYIICDQNPKNPNVLAEELRVFESKLPPKEIITPPSHITPRVAAGPRQETAFIPRRDPASLPAAIKRRGTPRAGLNPGMQQAILHLCKTGLMQQVHKDNVAACYDRYYPDHQPLTASFGQLHGNGDRFPRASAFCVGKGKMRTIDAGVEVEILRVISDLREANAFFADPPAYEMFTLETLQQTISNLINMNEHVFAASIDWRHYFFQLPAHAGIRCFMRTPINETMEAHYMGAAMGFSWIPYIAQCATFSIVVGTDRGQLNPYIKKGFFNTLGDRLPPWLPLVNPDKATVQVGAIFIIFDNVFIIGSDKTAVSGVLDYIRRNVIKFGVWEKAESDGTLPTVQTLVRNRSSPSVEFAGVEVSGKGYRVTAKTFRKYVNDFELRLTRRELASRAGKVYWFMRVSNYIFLEHPIMMDILQNIAPQGAETYDSFTTITDDQRLFLCSMASQAMSRDDSTSWHILPTWGGLFCSQPRVAFFASDAAGWQLHGRSCIATIGFTFNSSPVPSPRWPGFTFDSEEKEIAVRELEGYVKGVAEERGKLGPDAWARIHVVIGAIDNRVAEGWIERFFSENERARCLLLQLRQILGSCRCATVRVTSEQNLADIPTRRAAADGPFTREEFECCNQGPARLDATIRVLLQAAKSINISTTGRLAETLQPDPPAGAQREREVL